jgi:putative ABC transport system permease protein
VIRRFGKTQFLRGDAELIWRAMAERAECIISEPFANKHGIREGQTIALGLGGEQASFRVAGIYHDYSNERGYVIVDRAVLLSHLPDQALSNAAVYLKPGVKVAAAREAIEAAVAGREIIVAANRALREEGLRTFDRTFAVTWALEAVAIFVAVLGIAGALLAMVIDRKREMGLLRFLGAAPGQIRGQILYEAGLLGLLSLAVGALLGGLLSWVLIYVINVQSFGWTIEFHWPTGLMLFALAGVFVATIVAGVWPARAAMRLNPIEVIHEE